MTTKHVPFFELKRVYEEQREEIDRAVTETLRSGWYILGQRLAAFESEFSKDLTGRDGAHSIGCNSGTDAIILALLTAGVGPGDEVIVPSHTAIPTITAIRSTGARPVFADVDAKSWVVGPAEIEPLLTSKTRAIVAVHLYGNMADVDAIQKMLDHKKCGDVTLIEDVAQAQGSMLNGRQAGTIARLGAFSFYPSKNIGALGDGGAVFARDEQDVATLKMLRNYGQKDRYNALLDRGLNSRLDEVQASVLSVRLPRLREWNRRKEAQVARYRKDLAGLPLKFQTVTQGCVPAWHLFVIALESQRKRDDLMAYLKNQEVDTIIHYPIPTHLQKAFQQAKAPRLPVTEALASSIVSLPMNACLTAEEQGCVIEKVQAFFA